MITCIVRIWEFIKNYAGILLFISSLLVIFFVPYFWAYNYTVFKLCAYAVLVIAILIYTNIAYRVANFSRYIGDLNKLVLILIESVLLFAAVYLWLLLLFRDNSFADFEQYKYLWSVTKSNYVWSKYLNTLFEAAINYIHFSIVTAATVGYGDIYPKGSFPKIVVDFQIIYTFAIVIIGIGKFGEKAKIYPHRESQNKYTRTKYGRSTTTRRNSNH